MRYYLVIENNEYTIIRVKPENIEQFVAANGNRLLLQAESLMELLLLFENEVVYNNKLHLN